MPHEAELLREVLKERGASEAIARWIISYARARGLDPYLFGGLIWHESRFRPEARGAAGEIGLGQLMPLALEDAAEWDRGLRPATLDRLWDPEYNLRASSAYLARMFHAARTTYQARVQEAGLSTERAALVFYNAGPGDVHNQNGRSYAVAVQARAVQLMQEVGKRNAWTG